MARVQSSDLGKELMKVNILSFEPVSLRTDIGMIAFYFPGREAPCDRLCKAFFLGNFYDMNSINARIELKHCKDESRGYFRTAEGAYQAAKFWDYRTMFEEADGQMAFDKSRVRGSGPPDFKSSGYPNSWQVMYAVLRGKFQCQKMAQALLSTEEAFLLEHNSSGSRDNIWSNGGDGTGTNWLGLQLMLVRNELRSQSDLKISRCCQWDSLVDQSTGATGQEWRELVMLATQSLNYYLKQSDVRTYY